MCIVGTQSGRLVVFGEAPSPITSDLTLGDAGGSCAPGPRPGRRPDRKAPGSGRTSAWGLRTELLGVMLFVWRCLVNGVTLQD